ncbi:MAG: TIGR03560 family F420-dependent LLM class oxidoreductase [Candidatus Bathyarchaeota archaeon]
MDDVDFGVMLPVMIPSSTQPRSLYHVLQYNYPKLDVGVVEDVALEAERLGYHSIWVSDHLSRAACRERLECWTTMTWLATLTERIRIGSMVICNLYRHPALMAKMASTLDVLSGGRLEFGIGACWSEDECTDRGIEWPSNEVRLQMLGESVRIIKSLWTEETTNFRGRHYHLQDAPSEPKPLQKPHPPVMIGGGGEGFTLRLVAKYADKSNFGGTLPDIERRMKALRRHCRAVGRDYDSIEKTTNIAVVLHPTQQEYHKDMRRRWQADGSHGSFDDWLREAEKLYIAGTPQDCAEQLISYIDLGINLFVIRFGDIPNLEGLKLFARAVLPRIC